MALKELAEPLEAGSELDERWPKPPPRSKPDKPQRDSLAEVTEGFRATPPPAVYAKLYTADGFVKLWLDPATFLDSLAVIKDESDRRGAFVRVVRVRLFWPKAPEYIFETRDLTWREPCWWENGNFQHARYAPTHRGSSLELEALRESLEDDSTVNERRARMGLMSVPDGDVTVTEFLRRAQQR